MRTRSALLSLTGTFLLALPALGQTPSAPRVPMTARLSPLVPIETFSNLGMRFATDRSMVEDLRGIDALRLQGVVVPSKTGFQTVDLELSRVDPVSDDMVIRVDGQVVGGAPLAREGVSLWNGVVAGEEGSDVYIAFSPTGTRGWITREEGRSHFYALPADGDWRRTSTVLVHQDDPFVQENIPTWTCATDTSGAVPFEEHTPENLKERNPLGGQQASTQAGTVECKIAIETDFQFYSLFNDQTAVMNYVISLWGATSCRFVDATSVFITIPYLAIYTTSNDPWKTPDVGGSTSQMLNEFQNYWIPTGFPNGANLTHFMSGASLGGGVAYLNGFCSLSGVAVSANLHGQTNIPVPTKSSLNWDFVVTAHETGHQFGSPHTHDYCPPIDECFPGLCSSGNGCTSNGTIMGYCHLCPGGLNNVQTFFHNRVANQMLGVVSVSCLCTLCPCKPPKINSASPNVVVAYDPAGQEVVLTGKRFAEVQSVLVDGVPLPASQFTVDSSSVIRFQMPLVSRTGNVGVTVEDDCGQALSLAIEVDPPAEAQLGLQTGPLVNVASGLTPIVSADPGDLAFLFYSTEQIPTVLPGYLSLEIGNNFTSLGTLFTATIGNQAWESQSFSLVGVPIGTVVYLQAAVLNGPGMFPLESSQSATAAVWF